MKKNVFKRLTVLLVSSGLVFGSVTVGFGAQTLYEQVTQNRIVKGVNYANKYRLTDEGWLNLHIITVDMNNGNISVNPVMSQKDAGLRQTVSTLLTDNGALAGVNSAYFGMTGNYSAAFAPQIANGNILSMDADKNIDANQFGTYFMDSNGNSYFNYFKTDLDFYVEGYRMLEVAGMNTITQMVYPVYIDQQLMKTTQSIDSRFQNIQKIVVENNRITKVSAKGEVVNVPENGYIIALSEEYADANEGKFVVGQSVEFKINTVFNVENIETAISGGGIILKDGVKPENYGEMASGKHPRTLLGISQDGSMMKLIVAEGQRTGGSSSSIGLTVDEAVALLKSEGMYHGLNLDGGGSSLMAIKTSDADNVVTVSAPPEGSERPVMTAVGVFDNSAVGPITELVIKPQAQRVTAGGSVTFEVFGYDDNYHKIAVPMSSVTMSVDENIGSVTNNIFNGKNQGTAYITASYEGITTTEAINVVGIGALVPDSKSISLSVGQSATITVKGQTSDGYTVDLGNNVEFSSTFGTMNGNVFSSDTEGAGYIKCSYNGLETYIKVTVGTKEVKVDSFENIQYLNFDSYPTTIEGIAGVSGAYKTDGQKSLGLSYYFAASQSTQAAYLEFPQAIQISGNPAALTLDIKGNGSGQWVRGKIIDANGAETIIDFSKDVNWTDWKTVTAEIPSTVTYPIRLKQIYVAALSNDNTAQQVMYFDNLRAQVAVDSDVALPQDVKNMDSLEGSTSGKESGYTYFNFAGNVTGTVSDMNLYTSARVSVNNALGANTDYAVFAGTNDISASNGASTINFKEGYQVYNNGNATLINMFAKHGGFASTQKSQWTSFKSDAINAPNKNVIIFMDLNPDAFTDKEEGKLFKNALKEIADGGKNVFVLYTNAGYYSQTQQEGVRYIALPNLWTSGGAVNSDFRIVRFKAGGDSLTFEAINVF